MWPRCQGGHNLKCLETTGLESEQYKTISEFKFIPKFGKINNIYYFLNDFFSIIEAKGNHGYC